MSLNEERLIYIGFLKTRVQTILSETGPQSSQVLREFYEGFEKEWDDNSILHEYLQVVKAKAAQLDYPMWAEYHNKFGHVSPDVFRDDAETLLRSLENIPEWQVSGNAGDDIRGLMHRFDDFFAAIQANDVFRRCKALSELRGLFAFLRGAVTQVNQRRAVQSLERAGRGGQLVLLQQLPESAQLPQQLLQQLPESERTQPIDFTAMTSDNLQMMGLHASPTLLDFVCEGESQFAKKLLPAVLLELTKIEAGVTGDISEGKGVFGLLHAGLVGLATVFCVVFQDWLNNHGGPMAMSMGIYGNITSYLQNKTQQRD